MRNKFVQLLGTTLCKQTACERLSPLANVILHNINYTKAVCRGHVVMSGSSKVEMSIFRQKAAELKL